MAVVSKESHSPYEYPSSWLTKVEYRLKDGYAYIQVPKGTVLYHGSKLLPITASSSGKTILPDPLHPASFLADTNKAGIWGFTFPFVLTKDILLLDMLSGWNLAMLLDRPDMSEVERKAIQDVTGFGITQQQKKRPINCYRNKPSITMLWLLGSEADEKDIMADWICGHGFEGFARNDLLIHSPKGPIYNSGHLVISRPSEYLKPRRIDLAKLTSKERNLLLNKEREIRNSGAIDLN